MVGHVFAQHSAACSFMDASHPCAPVNVATSSVNHRKAPSLPPLVWWLASGLGKPYTSSTSQHHHLPSALAPSKQGGHETRRLSWLTRHWTCQCCRGTRSGDGIVAVAVDVTHVVCSVTIGYQLLLQSCAGRCCCSSLKSIHTSGFVCMWPSLAQI